MANLDQTPLRIFHETKMALTLCPKDGDWLMKLEMQENLVTQITFGFGMSLETNKGFEVRVENAFTLQTPQGDLSLVPGESTTNPEQLNRLLNQTIVSADTDQSGILMITFTDGTRLQVKPDDTYGAWTVTGPGGMKVVCMPGGELAIWSPQDE